MNQKTTTFSGVIHDSALVLRLYEMIDHARTQCGRRPSHIGMNDRALSGRRATFCGLPVRFDKTLEPGRLQIVDEVSDRGWSVYA